MSKKRKEALGKFLINLALLYLGTGVLAKVFSQETFHAPLKLFFTLLPAFIFLMIGVYLYPKE
jgi:lipopolysaccharide export LptBFGC system permease protein LptF